MLKFSFLLAIASIALYLGPAATARAQGTTSLPPGYSDELTVFDVSGAPVFDQFIPEGTAAAGPVEPTLVYNFGSPVPGSAPAVDPAVAMTQGALVTLLLDPPGEVQEPGEAPIPIVIPGIGPAFLSDAVVSTLNLAITNPTAFPPQVILLSDPNPYLQEIAADLPNAALPPLVLYETGGLQNTNALDFSAAPQYGLSSVQVASDTEIPEPTALSLIGMASLALMYRSRRRA